MKLIIVIVLLFISLADFAQGTVRSENGMIDIKLSIQTENTKNRLPLSAVISSIKNVEHRRTIADSNGAAFFSFCPEFLEKNTLDITVYEHGFFTETFHLEISTDTSITLYLRNNPTIQTTIEGIGQLHDSLFPISCGWIYTFPSGRDYYEHCSGSVRNGNMIDTNELSTGEWKLLTDEKYLIPIYKTPMSEPGDSVCFINPKSDTIIPFGRYTTYGNQNVIKNFGTVMAKKDGQTLCLAIDTDGNELFEIYWFENGPDYLKDGLFRIIKNDKIGFANAEYKIIIKPQYQCADFFRNGKARVTYSCEMIPQGEHTAMQSTSWFYIDINGNRINPKD